MEDAYPSLLSPSTVTVGGSKYEVMSSAYGSFADFALGKTVTLLLNDKGDVVSAAPAMNITGYAILMSATSKEATIQTTDGVTMTLQGSYTGSMLFKSSFGKLVTYSYSGSKATISFAKMYNKDNSICDFSNMTVGSHPISKNVIVYEGVGNASAVISKVSITDVEDLTLPSSKLRGYNVNSFGYVDMIFLDNVTETRYKFGLIDNTSDETSGTPYYTSFTYYEDGEQKTYAFSQNVYDSKVGTGMIGAAVDITGAVKNFIKPVSKGKVTRDAFYFEDTVKVGDITYDISENCVAVNKSTEIITSLSKAKSLYSSFEIYIESDSNPIVVAVVVG